MNRIFIVSALFLSASGAGATILAIDSVHSSVGFKIRHFAGRVPGSFSAFSGTIEFDEKDFSKSSVEAAIEIASVDTHNEMRNKHLKTPDYFDAAKFPLMTFKSKKVVPDGKKKFKVEGVLSLHGVEKPVTLDVEYLGTEKDPKGKTHAGFAAETKISRKDFGVGGMGIGDEVAISIDIESAEAEPKAK